MQQQNNIQRQLHYTHEQQEQQKQQQQQSTNETSQAKDLHPIFTASWHSHRHEIVSCGHAGKVSLCIECSASYLSSQNSPREHILELLDLLTTVQNSKLAPHASFLQQWLFYVLTSYRDNLSFRIGLLSAALIAKQEGGSRNIVSSKFFSDFFSAIVSQDAIQHKKHRICLAVAMKNPALALAALKSHRFKVVLLAQPELTESSLAIQHSILRSEGSERFAHDFIRSLFDGNKLRRVLHPSNSSADGRVVSEALLMAILKALQLVDTSALDEPRIRHMLRALVPIFGVKNLQTYVIEICVFLLDRGVDGAIFIDTGMITTIITCPRGFQNERVAFLTLAMIRKLSRCSTFFAPEIVIVTLDLLTAAVKNLVQTKIHASCSQPFSSRRRKGPPKNTVDASTQQMQAKDYSNNDQSWSVLVCTTIFTIESIVTSPCIKHQNGHALEDSQTLYSTTFDLLRYKGIADDKVLSAAIRLCAACLIPRRKHKDIKSTMELTECLVLRIEYPQLDSKVTLLLHSAILLCTARIQLEVSDSNRVHQKFESELSDTTICLASALCHQVTNLSAENLSPDLGRAIGLLFQSYFTSGADNSKKRQQHEHQKMAKFLLHSFGLLRSLLLLREECISRGISSLLFASGAIQLMPTDHGVKALTSCIPLDISSAIRYACQYETSAEERNLAMALMLSRDLTELKQKGKKKPSDAEGVILEHDEFGMMCRFCEDAMNFQAGKGTDGGQSFCSKRALGIALRMLGASLIAASSTSCSYYSSSSWSSSVRWADFEAFIIHALPSSFDILVTDPLRRTLADYILKSFPSYSEMMFQLCWSQLDEHKDEENEGKIMPKYERFALTKAEMQICRLVSETTSLRREFSTFISEHVQAEAFTLPPFKIGRLVAIFRAILVTSSELPSQDSTASQKLESTRSNSEICILNALCQLIVLPETSHENTSSLKDDFMALSLHKYVNYKISIDVKIVGLRTILEYILLQWSHQSPSSTASASSSRQIRPSMFKQIYSQVSNLMMNTISRAGTRSLKYGYDQLPQKCLNASSSKLLDLMKRDESKILMHSFNLCSCLNSLGVHCEVEIAQIASKIIQSFDTEIVQPKLNQIRLVCSANSYYVSASCIVTKSAPISGPPCNFRQLIRMLSYRPNMNHRSKRAGALLRLSALQLIAIGILRFAWWQEKSAPVSSNISKCTKGGIFIKNALQKISRENHTSHQNTNGEIFDTGLMNALQFRLLDIMQQDTELHDTKSYLSIVPESLAARILLRLISLQQEKMFFYREENSSLENFSILKNLMACPWQKYFVSRCSRFIVNQHRCMEQNTHLNLSQLGLHVWYLCYYIISCQTTKSCCAFDVCPVNSNLAGELLVQAIVQTEGAHTNKYALNHGIDCVPSLFLLLTILDRAGRHTSSTLLMQINNLVAQLQLQHKTYHTRREQHNFSLSVYDGILLRTSNDGLISLRCGGVVSTIKDFAGDDGIQVLRLCLRASMQNLNHHKVQFCQVANDFLQQQKQDRERVINWLKSPKDSNNRTDYSSFDCVKDKFVNDLLSMPFRMKQVPLIETLCKAKLSFLPSKLRTSVKILNASMNYSSSCPTKDLETDKDTFQCDGLKSSCNSKLLGEAISYSCFEKSTSGTTNMTPVNFRSPFEYYHSYREIQELTGKSSSPSPLLLALQGENNSLQASQFSLKILKEWQTLSESILEPYRRAAAIDRDRYLSELKRQSINNLLINHSSSLLSAVQLV